MKGTTVSRGNVLIVDDDLAVLTLLQNVLLNAQYRVLLAAERADALRLVAQKHLHMDVVLLDVRMPGVKGTELADGILAIRPDIRVLWMSGCVDDEIIRIKMLDGYAGFLEKPLRREGVLRAVEEAMEGRRPERAFTAGGSC